MRRWKCALAIMLFVSTSVLAWWGTAGALPFTFRINRFSIVQLTTLVDDRFDDGNEPPLGSVFGVTDDTSGCLPSSCTYRSPTIGTFGANDETGGSLILNDIGGDIGVTSGVPRVRKGAQLRRRIRQSRGAFSFEADYKGILPRDTQALGFRESYRIQLSSSGGTDNVNLRVENQGGVPAIRFRNTSSGMTLGTLFPGALMLEITLRLDVDEMRNVTAFFDPDGPLGGAGFSPIGGSTTIYNSEDFTRARFFAQSPVPEPSTLLFLGFGLVGLGLWGSRKFKERR